MVSIELVGVWVRFSAATTAERFLPERLAARAYPFAQRLDAMLASANGNGQAGRMSLIAFSLRIINAVIAFASQVLLARYMGGFEYGIFVLVWVTVIILGNISCLGFHTSVIRFIPEYRAKNMLGELRGMVNASRIFVLLSSTAFMAIGWLGLWLFEAQIERYYILPFYLGLICLPMIALGDQLQGIARANAWPLLALAPTYVLRPILLLLFLFAIHIAGYEPDAENAVLAAILATWLTTIAQAIGMRMQRTEKITTPQKLRLGDWVAVSLPIFLVESIFFLQTNADVLMVGRYMQPTDVAIYYAAVKTLALVHFVYFAVKAGVAQRFATLIHAGDREALSAFVSQSVNWTFWPSLAMGLGRAGAGPADPDVVRRGVYTSLSASPSSRRRGRCPRQRRPCRKPAYNERPAKCLCRDLCLHARAQRHSQHAADPALRPVGGGDCHLHRDDV